MIYRLAIPAMPRRFSTSVLRSEICRSASYRVAAKAAPFGFPSRRKARAISRTFSGVSGCSIGLLRAVPSIGARHKPVTTIRIG